ncbi:hypothetical protein G6M89_19950 [Natronolimnobius sp. AArcel1]|uniref:hypothetical protein n=1 Tax=Natronolimnobius sp. AArcel1 TaxID=1679093 RepID=UPI0013E9E48B|nr:hypothetical protein [Natronolimnobius sp. AArcel1]NGM71248.1 hypothetical protein [Natronolimnobius sp. AArcel1]
MKRSRKIGTWVGLVLIGGGAFLPWITANPLTQEPALLLYPAGLGSGFEVWGVLTLTLALAAAIGIRARVRWLDSPTVRIGVGLVSLSVATEFIVRGSLMSGQYVAGSGVLMTILGGAILVATQLDFPQSLAASIALSDHRFSRKQ